MVKIQRSEMGKAEYRGHRRDLLQESRWWERDDEFDILARARSGGIVKETFPLVGTRETVVFFGGVWN